MSARRLPARPRIGVVGATGAVGRVMLEILRERRFPFSEVVAIASKRSEGRTLPFGDQELSVVALDDAVLQGLDLVLFDTPDEIARDWAQSAADAGAVVVDNSAAWRMEEGVPLIVPEINGDLVWDHRGIIASPNCTTIDVVVPLDALHREFRVTSAVVSSYQATSGAGQPGVEELKVQAAKLYDQLDLLGAGEGPVPDANVFDAPIAFNVVPKVGSFRDLGYTSEEWKLLDESRKIMGLPDLRMTGTCVRVPTVVGHGASVYATFRSEVSAERATEVLRSAPGVALLDVPTPMHAAGKDPCYVGRIRGDQLDPHALWYFSVSDNLRKGAALNAVQIAELLLP